MGGTTEDVEFQKNMTVEEMNDGIKDPEIAVDGDHIGSDPFAPRQGKTLTWSNVNMTLAGKKGKEDHKILDDVWGEVPEREITAIMGPSGSGKTSLLNVLSGRTQTRGMLTVSSDIRLDNYVVKPTSIKVKQQIAFVAQDDSLMTTSTPREAIKFSARLRLPRSTTDDDIDKLTEKMLEELGLIHCADTFIGGELLKGVSGGERKRTSVGVELVTKPSLVFLDEPTSGLDSFSALQLVQVLHKVAKAGSSVMFTIHQPASEIFNSFDHLLLLNKGRIMYQGSVSNVPSYFENNGHPLPPNYNPADWIMTTAQKFPVQELEKSGFFPRDKRILGEPKEGAIAAFTSSMHSNDEYGYVDRRKVSALMQVKLLFKRELLDLKRDKVSVGTRFGITIFLNVLFGLIFLNVGRADSADRSNLNSHFGAAIMVLLSSMFGTAQPALFAIPVQRPVFLREYSTNHYTVPSYFLSRFTMEAIITFLQILVQNLINFWLIGFQSNFILFTAIIYTLSMASTAVSVLLGCSVEDAKMSQELLPMLFVPQMLFAGFFVIPSLIPVWLRWVQYLCSLTYGVRLFLIAEFSECASGVGDAAKNCKSLLETVDANPDEKWLYWLILLLLFAVLRLLAMYVLKKKASAFY